MLSFNKAMRVARAGQTWYSVWGHVNVDRFVKPYVEEIVVTVRSQTLQGVPNRNKNLGKSGWILNGSYLGYTRSKKHAEAQAANLRAGYYPEVISEMRDRDYEMDFIDEAWGVCDRGLGVLGPEMREEE